MVNNYRNRKSFRIFICTTALSFLYILYEIYKYDKQMKFLDDRRGLLYHMAKLITSNTGENFSIKGETCHVPELDVNATEILHLLKHHPRVTCNKSPDWVEVSGNTAKIAEWAKIQHGAIECAFTDVIRDSDTKQHSGITVRTATEFNFLASDIVNVKCTAADSAEWSKVLMGIRADQEIYERSGWSKLPPNALKLNVLMLGFDSLSHNMWKRKLPKSYKFATDELQGVALNGYNIVGDGTPQALIPILTGKTELELPDTRKRMGPKAQYVNVYPFVWNEFRQSGYATAWGEDLANVGTFTYRLKGFKEQPVDHYMRTFYMEASKHFKNHEPFCYGNLSRLQIMFKLARDMYSAYQDRPKFIFVFHSEYSHDSNDWISAADDDLFELLTDFHNSGALNNTLLILMSDHGSRFAALRNTQQGKQEERLPGFIFVLPPWFKSAFPEAMANLRQNADRLTTPFDIHATLRSILSFDRESLAKPPDLGQRSISLFSSVPIDRTCRAASIEPHWCTCLDWKTVSVDDPVASKAFEFFLNYINKVTLDYREFCDELVLGAKESAARLAPNKNLLAFKKNADPDGFIGDMSGNTKVLHEMYQIKVILNPGTMIFEASLSYHTKEERFSLNIADISRINKYSEMTHCIEDRDMLHELRKFCHCANAG